MAPKLTYLRQLYAPWQLTQTSFLFDDKLKTKFTNKLFSLHIAGTRSAKEGIIENVWWKNFCLESNWFNSFLGGFPGITFDEIRIYYPERASALDFKDAYTQGDSDDLFKETRFLYLIALLSNFQNFF